MFDPGPHLPLAYWPHVILGIASIAAAILAVTAAKGSSLHRRAGQVFCVTMGIAALTALVFVATVFQVPPLVSALTVIYGIVAGYGSLRLRKGALRVTEIAVFLVPLLLALLCWLTIAMELFSPSPEPMDGQAAVMLAGIVVTGLLFTAIAYNDVRYLRTAVIDRDRRYRRHAFRMALAATEVVRAPLITFGPELGPLTFSIYFFAPLALIPAIYFLAMPAWVREGRPTPPSLGLVT